MQQAIDTAWPNTLTCSIKKNNPLNFSPLKLLKVASHLSFFGLLLLNTNTHGQKIIGPSILLDSFTAEALAHQTHDIILSHLSSQIRKGVICIYQDTGLEKRIPKNDIAYYLDHVDTMSYFPDSNNTQIGYILRSTFPFDPVHWKLQTMEAHGKRIYSLNSGSRKFYFLNERVKTEHAAINYWLTNKDHQDTSDFKSWYFGSNQKLILQLQHRTETHITQNSCMLYRRLLPDVGYLTELDSFIFDSTANYSKFDSCGSPFLSLVLLPRVYVQGNEIRFEATYIVLTYEPNVNGVILSEQDYGFFPIPNISTGLSEFNRNRLNRLIELEVISIQFTRFNCDKE